MSITRKLYLASYLSISPSRVGGMLPKPLIHGHPELVEGWFDCSHRTLR